MTDFFADLEAEIRAAHPRRPKPVVPVRALAVAASVLMAIVSVATFLPSAEREVAQESPGADPVGTAYESGACGTKTMSGPAPKEILDRFAVLRKPGDTGTWKGGAPAAARLYPDSARMVGEGEFEALFLPVEFAASEDCEDLKPGICLIALRKQIEACSVIGEDPVLAAATFDEPGDERSIFILAEDSIEEVTVESRSARRLERGGHVSPTDNWFAYRTNSKPDEKLTVAPGIERPETVPGGACGTTFTAARAPDAVADVLGVFRSDVPRTPRGVWGDRGGVTGEDLRGAHVDDARVVVDSPRSWTVLAVSDLPPGHSFEDCSARREPSPIPRPGACAVHSRGDGAASEQKAGCWTLEQIKAGAAFTEFRDGQRRTIFGLVPDGVKTVNLIIDVPGLEVTAEHNLFVAETDKTGEVRLRFVE
jgi:hypothetical protein